MDDLGEVSRIVVRALLVLMSFPADGSKREVTAVAKRLGLSLSATHRYAATWVAVGLLERDADSRRYGRTSLS
jgi:DNA-binding IclR family transcriptional regulator